MFSFKAQLERAAGQQQTLRNNLTEKHNGKLTKKYIEERIKLLIEGVNTVSLMNVAGQQRYLLFCVHTQKHFRSVELIICNTISKGMNIDGVRYTYKYLTNKDIDFNKHIISIKYLFKLFKRFSKNIEDVQRIVNDSPMRIGYKWNIDISKDDDCKLDLDIANKEQNEPSFSFHNQILALEDSDLFY